MKKIRAYNCTELLEVYPNYVKACSHVVHNNLLYSVKSCAKGGKIHLGNSESIVFADIKDVKSVAKTEWRQTFDHDKSTEVAIDWWNTLNTMEKIKINLSSRLLADGLTNLEIEKHYCDYLHSQRKQVDFKDLKSVLPMIEALADVAGASINMQAKIDNLKLFMEMMSKSSSFAHKAHKELKQINRKESVKSYTFRNLPITNATHCIVGESNNRGALESGILEWCTSAWDAIDLLEVMKQYSQFSNLRIERIAH